MTIGIILHPFGEDKPAGLGRYIFDLTVSLLENDKKNEYIIYLKNKPKVLPVFPGSNWRVEVVGFGGLWRELGLFFAPRSDVYIFNTPVVPLFFKPRRSIVIVLDYAYRYSKTRNFKRALGDFLLFRMNKLALKRASAIVAISEFTKKETIRLFGIKKEKIKMIYPGFWNVGKESEREPIVPVPLRFFLFVGVIKERKNVCGIVQGFHKFKQSVNSGHKLIIAGWGSGKYYEKIINYIKNNNLNEDVFIYSQVTGKNLVPFYRKAEALVFPSFVEGFGFPILEAMSCGLPVITAKTSSTGEVAGDAAVLVDPGNSGEIAFAMEKIIKDPGFRSSLMEKGRRRAEKFSWEKTTRDFLDIINQL